MKSKSGAGLAVSQEEALTRAEAHCWAPSASVKAPLWCELGIMAGILPMCQVTQVAACSKHWIWQVDGSLFRNPSSFILNIFLILRNSLRKILL